MSSQNYFDPKQMQQSWQQWMNSFSTQTTPWSGMANFSQFQNMSQTFTKSMQGYMQKQMQMSQKTMEQSVECMKDLASAKGIEDFMAKQTNWMQKSTDTWQSCSQDMFKSMQDMQSQTLSAMQQAQTSTTSKSTSK